MFPMFSVTMGLTKRRVAGGGETDHGESMGDGAPAFERPAVAADAGGRDGLEDEWIGGESCICQLMMLERVCRKVLFLFSPDIGDRAHLPMCPGEAARGRGTLQSHEEFGDQGFYRMTREGSSPHSRLATDPELQR